MKKTRNTPANRPAAAKPRQPRARLAPAEAAPKVKEWRTNAAAIIMDPDGYILLGKDHGRNPYWHFPQGGVAKNEPIEQTLAREVWEEVGLRPSDYIIVDRIAGLRYKYPAGNSKITRWVGQEQTYFLIRCKQQKPQTDLHRSPEFAKTRWILLQDLKPEMFPKFKRKVIKDALKHFFSKKIKPGQKAAPVKKAAPSVTNLSSTLTLHTMNRYLVPPGKKLRLKDHSTDDKSLFAGTKEEALIEFDKLREELQELQKKLFAQHKYKILVILQAMDAGGKDGCVKHVFSRVDPQGIHVVPFKKPSAEELDHDFLWRIHKQVPGKGQITIFNRSHYEDIIAVRVKKIFPDAVWKRRYKHVLDFESMLAEEGTIIIKLFLNISKAEQKRRLESRLQDPNKLWKFCMDDLDDRNRWNEFQAAYQDLIEKTSTPAAPWYIIPGDRKWYRNLVVAKLMVEKLKALQLSFPPATFDPETITIPD